MAISHAETAKQISEDNTLDLIHRGGESKGFVARETTAAPKRLRVFRRFAGQWTDT